MCSELKGQAGVNVVSIAIFAWALIETADDRWDFAWLDDIINLLHGNGISVDLGTATASPPPWLTKAHPEILPVNKNGETLYPGSRQQWRPISPIFRKYAMRLVRKLAERYGSHPAVIAWHVNNELGCAHAHDYSEDAAAAFRLWLERRYGTIEALNSAWGTAFWSQRYNDFDEILPPRIAPTFINPTQQLDWARFSSDALNEYLQAERKILHELSPGVPVTTNFMLAGQTKGMDVANWEVDFVSNDHYRYHARANDADELSFSASLTSAVAGRRPWWLMEHSTGAVNWQAVNKAKPRGGMARDSLTHVAHGADAVCYFQWRQSAAGAEKFHSSMVPHGGAKSRGFRDAVELGRHLKELAGIRGSHKLAAPVAILWDWDSWVASELDGHPSSLIDYFREALEWYVALLDLGIRVDVVPSQSDISPYKLIIAPVLYLVKGKLKTKIHDFVRGGGHFVTTYFSGIVDENDHAVLGGYPGAFSEMLGIRVEEWAPLFDHERVTLDDGSFGTIWTEEIEVIDAKVLRRYADGDTSGSPAITCNRYGQGTATYVSTRLENDLAKLLPDLLASAGVCSDLPEPLRGAVDHVIRTDGRTKWDFYINRGGMEVQLDVEGTLVMTSRGDSNRLAGHGVAVFERQA